MKKYAPCLTEKDKLRFNGMTHPNRKLQFLMGRLLIYRFLGHRFKVEESGKLSHKNSFLSLSHSQNLVILALSKKPVGIDTENVLKEKNFQDICRHLKWKNCHNLKEFYKRFTQYEAEYKLGKEYQKPHHKFLLWKDFIICVVSPSKETIEVFEYLPN